MDFEIELALLIKTEKSPIHFDSRQSPNYKSFLFYSNDFERSKKLEFAIIFIQSTKNVIFQNENLKISVDNLGSKNKIDTTLKYT